MGPGRESFGVRHKWIVVFYVLLIVIILLALLTNIFKTREPGRIPQLAWLLGLVVLLIAVISLLAKAFAIHSELEQNGAKIDKISESFEKLRTTLNQIEQSSHISEKVKAIAFHDSNKQALREAVFDRLQRQDFGSAYSIIDEVAAVEGYDGFARELRAEADSYHDATDTERVTQMIAIIDRLLDSYEWQKASAQIERLIKDYPGSDKARLMRQKLIDKKQERKKVLLRTWDDAVKREATDRSLEILRELDQYLSPNEALALQEAARSVFRSKLHSLGVQFSLAVSGRQWAQAVDTGKEIIRDFPNSRMAEEIREKMEILREKALQ
jgi:ABC-type multidrug transport system fused ATPase/permease subunit